VKVTFGDVTLDPEGMQLERHGSIVAVEPQVFEVLAYLIEHRDRLVPKTELLDEIWGDRFVSESALSSRIKSARRAIGDNGRDQRLIRTVHGRGFRFVGDIEAADLPRRSLSADGSHAAPAPRPGARSGPDTPTGAVGDVPVGADDIVAIVLGPPGRRGGTRGVALALVGPVAASRTEAVDDILFAASAAGVPVGRGGGGRWAAGVRQHPRRPRRVGPTARGTARRRPADVSR
jgi:DNA-binding winged helix-turn-helix (wHTH) protein